MSFNILIVGTGRMAFHLGYALRKAGNTIIGVAGRSLEKTQGLAKKLGSAPYSIIEELPKVDVVIIAVSDQAIEEVAGQLTVGDVIVAHTSGAGRVELLSMHEHAGVLWPIQSLSGEEPLDLSTVPLVVEGSSEQALNALQRLAGSLSTYVQVMSYEQRKKVHLAAVIASNFPVFMLEKAQQLLQQENIDPKTLNPLWNATTRKATLFGPEAVLTGPAIRRDVNTIEQHVQELSDDPDLRELYALISRMIMENSKA